MKTYIIIKKYFKVLINSYDWSLANNSAYKRLFPDFSSEKAIELEMTFHQFNRVVINEDETVYGEFKNGQQVLIAKTPFILNKLKHLRVT